LLRLYVAFFFRRRDVLGVSRGSKFVCLVLRRGQVASAALLDSGTITGNEIHMCSKRWIRRAYMSRYLVRSASLTRSRMQDGLITTQRNNSRFILSPLPSICRAISIRGLIARCERDYRPARRKPTSHSCSSKRHFGECRRPPRHYRDYSSPSIPPPRKIQSYGDGRVAGGEVGREVGGSAGRIASSVSWECAPGAGLTPAA